MNDLFVKATRKKFRFPFKGMISIEDLWDLNVVNLDTIFKTLNGEAKKAKEDSLLSTKSTEDKELDEKIEIIKYIVSVKLAEADKREKDAAIREEKRRIQEILANKKDEALQKKSVEELEAMLNKLNQ